MDCGYDFRVAVAYEAGHLAGGPVHDFKGGGGVEVEAGGAGYEGGVEGGAEEEEVWVG